ncbi:MAG TPA: hypothetical protein VG248_09540 [Caulobacteraceae bacterium]|jgi:hypothetical protein|nr:hypothetical protein [Caulobacteraceae bacterium]
MLAVGAAFWLASTGSQFDPGRPHLFFVLTVPCDADEQLIANMASISALMPHDKACLLRPQDHPAVVRPSYIRYDYARTASRRNFEVWQLGHQMRPAEAASVTLLQRIRSGLLRSGFAVPRLKEYLQEQLEREKTASAKTT